MTCLTTNSPDGDVTAPRPYHGPGIVATSGVPFQPGLLVVASERVVDVWRVDTDRGGAVQLLRQIEVLSLRDDRRIAECVCAHDTIFLLLADEFNTLELRRHSLADGKKLGDDVHVRPMCSEDTKRLCVDASGNLACVRSDAEQGYLNVVCMNFDEYPHPRQRRCDLTFVRGNEFCRARPAYSPCGGWVAIGCSTARCLCLIDVNNDGKDGELPVVGTTHIGNTSSDDQIVDFCFITFSASGREIAVTYWDGAAEAGLHFAVLSVCSKGRGKEVVMRHLWHAVDEKRVTAAAPTLLFNAANFMLVWGEEETPVLRPSDEPDAQAFADDDGDGEDGGEGGEDALDYVRPVVVVSPVLGGKRTARAFVEQIRFGTDFACAPVMLGDRQDVAALKIYDDSLQFFFAS